MLEGRGVGAGELPCLRTAPRWQGKVPRGRMHWKLVCRRGACYACFVRVRVRVLEAGGGERKAARSIMHACFVRVRVLKSASRERVHASCLCVCLRLLVARRMRGGACMLVRERACACRP